MNQLTTVAGHDNKRDFTPLTSPFYGGRYALRDNNFLKFAHPARRESGLETQENCPQSLNSGPQAPARHMQAGELRHLEQLYLQIFIFSAGNPKPL